MLVAEKREAYQAAKALRDHELSEVQEAESRQAHAHAACGRAGKACSDDGVRPEARRAAGGGAAAARRGAP